MEEEDYDEIPDDPHPVIHDDSEAEEEYDRDVYHEEGVTKFPQGDMRDLYVSFKNDYYKLNSSPTMELAHQMLEELTDLFHKMVASVGLSNDFSGELDLPEFLATLKQRLDAKDLKGFTDDVTRAWDIPSMYVKLHHLYPQVEEKKPPQVRADVEEEEEVFYDADVLDKKAKPQKRPPQKMTRGERAVGAVYRRVQRPPQVPQLRKPGRGARAVAMARRKTLELQGENISREKRRVQTAHNRFHDTQHKLHAVQQELQLIELRYHENKEKQKETYHLRFTPRAPSADENEEYAQATKRLHEDYRRDADDVSKLYNDLVHRLNVLRHVAAPEVKEPFKKNFLYSNYVPPEIKHVEDPDWLPPVSVDDEKMEVPKRQRRKRKNVDYSRVERDLDEDVHQLFGHFGQMLRLGSSVDQEYVSFQQYEAEMEAHGQQMAEQYDQFALQQHHADAQQKQHAHELALDAQMYGAPPPTVKTAKLSEAHEEKAWEAFEGGNHTRAVTDLIDANLHKEYFQYNHYMDVFEPREERDVQRVPVAHARGHTQFEEIHRLKPHPIQETLQDKRLERLEGQQPLGNVPGKPANLGEYIKLKILPASIHIHIRRGVQETALKLLAKRIIEHRGDNPTTILHKRIRKKKTRLTEWLKSHELSKLDVDALFQRLLKLTNDRKKNVTIIVKQGLKGGAIHDLWDKTNSLL